MCGNLTSENRPFRKQQPIRYSRLAHSWRDFVLAVVIMISPTAGNVFAKAVIYKTAAAPGYVLIKGTSTLHNWKIRSQGLSGTVEFAMRSKGHATKLILKNIHLSIRVLSLKGSDGSGMDKTIYRKLLARMNPQITFVLKKAVLSHKSHAGVPWTLWDVTGILTAAGHPKQIHLQLKVLTARNGTIAIETRTVLKMTDFGISPPTAILGAIRSGNKMHIQVLWNLTPAKRK
ncbi:MAG: YceI family protein [Phycisphaerae bacterium]